MSQYILTQSNFSATGYTVQKYGYTQQWNFDIQRELPLGFFADVAYAGAHGVHLPQSNPNINQIPDSFINTAHSQFATGGAAAVARSRQPRGSYPVSLQPGIFPAPLGQRACSLASLTDRSRSTRQST